MKIAESRKKKYFMNLAKKIFSKSFIYVTGKMDVLGKTILPRQNGFAGRKIRFTWIDQAKWIWTYFLSYLFV